MNSFGSTPLSVNDRFNNEIIGFNDSETPLPGVSTPLRDSPDINSQRNVDLKASIQGTLHEDQNNVPVSSVSGISMIAYAR